MATEQSEGQAVASASTQHLSKGFHSYKDSARRQPTLSAYWANAACTACTGSFTTS